MNQYAFVTGAAKGIGRSIAIELAKRNYKLLLTDRDETSLNQTAAFIKKLFNTTVHIMVADLGEKDAPLNLWQWSYPFHDQLYVVVNNAGYGRNAPFIRLPLHEHLDLISVNVKALVSISHLFVPVLARKEKAWLLNVGSTTAYQSIPYLNTYASSKAFVLSFTRGLRQELKRSSVSVSCLSPGSTDTDFVHRAAMSARVQKIAERYNMSPERVAEIGVKGLFAGKAEIIPGLANRIHAYWTKFFPKSFVERIAAGIYGPDKTEKAFFPTIVVHEEEDYLAVIS